MLRAAEAGVGQRIPAASSALTLFGLVIGGAVVGGVMRFIVATCLGYDVGGAVAVAAVSSRATLMPTLSLLATVGLAYGVVAWGPARAGFLGPTEEA